MSPQITRSNNHGGEIAQWEMAKKKSSLSFLNPRAFDQHLIN